MYLATLRLKNFRNHLDSHFEFGTSTNVLVGDNGQGKTNVLEAISYLCLTKSFYASTDNIVLSFEQDGFEIDGRFVSGRGLEHTVRVAYEKNVSKKVVMMNRRSVEPFSTIIGKFPLVVCSPEHTPITIGSPADRRKFVDFLISQSSASYFETLIEYRRAVKHRNKILFDARVQGNFDSSVIEPWNEQIVKLGSSLMDRREKFVQEFHPYMRSAYHQLIGEEEEPAIQYLPMAHESGDVVNDRFEERLKIALQEKMKEEHRLGTTLVGPHRDEFAFKINGLDLRKYASQGQHKTFLVALKIAEFYYLKERCSETPIVLLDDVFSELDEHRSGRLLHFLGTISQTFVTSTEANVFDRVIEFGDRNKKFLIRDGAPVQQPIVAA